MSKIGLHTDVLYTCKSQTILFQDNAVFLKFVKLKEKAQHYDVLFADNYFLYQDFSGHLKFFYPKK